MKTQIVYVLVSSDKDLFLEELWVSVYSLRQFHPDVAVNVVTDDDTSSRIESNKALRGLITNIIVGKTPVNYNSKERSRELKTTIRELVKGDFLYIDTDTVICKPLDDIDCFAYDVAGVPDSNAWCRNHAFSGSMKSSVASIFGTDISSKEYLFICSSSLPPACNLNPGTNALDEDLSAKPVMGYPETVLFEIIAAESEKSHFALEPIQ